MDSFFLGNFTGRVGPCSYFTRLLSSLHTFLITLSHHNFSSPFLITLPHHPSHCCPDTLSLSLSPLSAILSDWPLICAESVQSSPLTSLALIIVILYTDMLNDPEIDEVVEQTSVISMEWEPGGDDEERVSSSVAVCVSRRTA